MYNSNKYAFLYHRRSVKRLSLLFAHNNREALDFSEVKAAFFIESLHCPCGYTAIPTLLASKTV